MVKHGSCCAELQARLLFAVTELLAARCSAGAWHAGVVHRASTCTCACSGTACVATQDSLAYDVCLMWVPQGA
jgi:hypothetical protein